MPTAPTLGLCLAVADLAERWACSRQHIYNLAARGDLAHMRIGALLRFRPEDVAAYEVAQHRAPVPKAQPIPSRSAPAAITSSNGRMALHAGYLAGLASRRKRAGS